MKKFIQLMFVVALISCLSCSNAFAVGLGTFIDLSSGSGDAEWDSDLYAWDIDSRAAAIGFVLDTAPTDESVFNYRLNVGLASLELEDNAGVTYESTGIYAENIFGFALIKKPDFRWWLGPLVRIGFFSGDADDGVQKVDLDMLELGVGVASGMNFKLNSHLILAPSLGLRINGYAGTGQAVGYADEDFEASSTTGFFNLALLF